MASSTLGIDGLISGLQTTDLINKLLQIESAPQTLLKTKQSQTTKLVTALQALNSKVASLGVAADTAAAPASWQAVKASSSAASVTASATSSALATQLTFTVDRLAGVQVSVTREFASPAELAGDSLPPKVVFESADGTHSVEIALDEVASVADLAHAITASDAGVTAVAVKTGPDTYRLQLTSKSSGAAGAFTMAAGDGTPEPLTTVSEASDAQITLWPGTAAEQTFTSSSNAFDSVVPGVTLKVSALESQPVTVSFASDPTALRSLASNLVSQLNLVFGEITSQTASSTTTDDTGRSIVTGGVLSGATGVRQLQSAISQAASYGVPYGGTVVSPSSVGIVIGKDGTFTFDQAAFDAALAADPEKVQAVTSALAARVASVAKTASDPYEGTLTMSIQAQQDAVEDLGDRIADWDRRLELRRETLQAQYTALEVTLSNLQSQSSWLASQLESLTASTYSRS